MKTAATRKTGKHGNAELRYWLGREIVDKRTRILASAQAVFAEQGFQSAEVKTIAERAGVGKATIYKFFPGKDALLLVIVDESLDYVRDLALAGLLGSGDPIVRLENTTVTIAKFLEQNRQFARILIQEAGEFTGEIQRRHLAMAENNLPFAEAFFATLRGQGYFRALDARETIHLMMNVLVGAVYTWAVSGDEKLEDKALRYQRVLIEGLRTEPEKINKTARRS